MLPIANIAERLDLPSAFLHPCGVFATKIALELLETPRRRAGDPRLVLVSGMTPTAAGEGKTATVIGLGDALSRLGQSVCLALREPSAREGAAPRSSRPTGSTCTSPATSMR
jgi:formate--tetrahydrofolate ligase